MKKIFINALSAKLGGGKTYIVNLLNYCPENLKIFVITDDDNIIPTHSNIIPVNSSFAKKNIIFRLLWEMLYLPIFLKIKKIDLLFVPGGMDFNFYSFNVPKVTMFRNMLPFDSRVLIKLSLSLKVKNSILKFLMLRTMKNSDVVIYISNYAKNVIRKFYNNSTDPVVYHGINDSFSPSSIIADDIRVQGKYILYVSRFEPYKNHINVIKAYNLLSAELKSEYKLLFIGEHLLPYYNDCAKLVEKYNLQKFVNFIGKVNYSDLPKYYRGCSLFIFASSCENCPNILLEAIGCGAPSIVSNTEPMPEFAGDCAYFFDENDHFSINSVMSNVLNNTSLLNELHESSLERRKKFRWHETAIRTWGIILERCNNV